jgi:hypothetical protein
MFLDVMFLNKKEGGVLDKNKMLGNVQKNNMCIGV